MGMFRCNKLGWRLIGVLMEQDYKMCRLFGKYSQNLLNTDIQSHTRLYGTKIPKDLPGISNVREKRLQNKRNNDLSRYKLELEVWHQQGDPVCDPETVTESEWNHAKHLKNEEGRRSYFKYLLTRSQLAESNQHEETPMDQAVEPQLYDFISDETMRKHQYSRLWKARIFNHPALVFDCAYDKSMKIGERVYIASQLQKCFKLNSTDFLPFNIHVCNANRRYETLQHLTSLIPDLMAPTNPMQVHSECFSSVFPKQQLVYLTPYSPNVLQKYSPNDVFVIACLQNHYKRISHSLPLARAKKLGIRTAWFPLQPILNWSDRPNDQHLSFTQITRVMLAIKESNNWTKAFEGLPKFVPQFVKPAGRRQFERDIRFRINKTIVGSGVPRHTGLPWEHGDNGVDK